MTLARRPWLYFGPAALVAGGIAVAIIAASDHEAHPAIAIALGLFVSWSFILAGLIGWTRRPTNRTGMLMVAVGFGVFIGSLGEANYPVPYTLGALFGSLFIAIFIHLLLAYPSGRLISRKARVLVIAGYVTAFVAPLLDSMFPAAPDVQAACLSRQPRLHLARPHRARRADGVLDHGLGGPVPGDLRAARRPLASCYPGPASHPASGLPRRRTEHRAARDRVRRDSVLEPRGQSREHRADRHVHGGAVPLSRRALGTTMAGAGLGTIFSGVPERASPARCRTV